MDWACLFDYFVYLKMYIAYYFIVYITIIPNVLFFRYIFLENLTINRLYLIRAPPPLAGCTNNNNDNIII